MQPTEQKGAANAPQPAAGLLALASVLQQAYSVLTDTVRTKGAPDAPNGADNEPGCTLAAALLLGAAMAEANAHAFLDNAIGAILAFCMGYFQYRHISEGGDNNIPAVVVAQESPGASNPVHALHSSAPPPVGQNFAAMISELRGMTSDWLLILHWGMGVAVPSDIWRGKSGTAMQATPGPQARQKAPFLVTSRLAHQRPLVQVTSWALRL